MTAPAILGLGHLDFTVTDGDRAMRWWEEVMGFKLLSEWGHAGYRGWTMAHPCGLVVTALTHAEGDCSAFDERRVGLDHVAFRVSDLDALKAWASRLDAMGVSHSGVQDIQGDRGGPLIVLRDPDNIQIELTAGWHGRNSGLKRSSPSRCQRRVKALQVGRIIHALRGPRPTIGSCMYATERFWGRRLDRTSRSR